mgnify:CR=1 FL=1
MKKWVFGCAMALVITSCDNKKFSIQGRVADADGQVLYLESLAVNGTELLDSVELDKDGRFKFKYHAPQYPEFYQLRLDKSIIHLAIDSTETLNLSANAADFANDYELTGSDECVKMRIVAQESAKLKKRIDELSRAMSSNSDRVDDLRKQAIEDLAAYKKKMFDLVLENPASATAYYIVFQEINGDKIFDPYDADDRKLIAAVATGFDSLYPDSPRSKQLKNMTLAAIAAERAAQKEKPEIEASGKVVLLSFTAYQADYSPAYNMKLAELYKKYKSKGLEIYQVSLDADEQAWKVAADNLPWVCVRDPQSVYSHNAAMYNVKTLPTCFVIDRNDGIVKRIEKVDEIENAVQSRL